jgi:teichoic acid transport system ATP-binding protein
VSDQIAIRVEDLHIRYRTVLDKKQTLRGVFSRKEREKRARNIRVVDAVRGVSFDVQRGSVLGIVGHNGAGKSTLLRAIAGILPPEHGRIEVAGQVSTLLALGLGFNQALSGRENIAIGGLAAGLSRTEIREREDEIIEFAGIGDFIDMPMRTYSSGMKGRLAFAVSTSLSPDILLIDEALSAGDAAFKKKAADRMKQLCGEDRTIVLVSHGLGSIRELADQAMWMAQGPVRLLGDPDEVVDAYTKAASVGDDVVANED